MNYSFLEEPGRRILVVNAVEKTWGHKAMRFGLGLSSDFQSASYFNVVGSYRRYWLNSLGAEWRTDLQFGRTSSLTSEFYQPLTPEGRFFIAPFVNYERRTSDIYQGDEPHCKLCRRNRQQSDLTWAACSASTVNCAWGC